MYTTVANVSLKSFTLLIVKPMSPRTFFDVLFWQIWVCIIIDTRRSLNQYLIASSTVIKIDDHVAKLQNNFIFDFIFRSPEFIN